MVTFPVTVIALSLVALSKVPAPAFKVRFPPTFKLFVTVCTVPAPPWVKL